MMNERENNTILLKDILKQGIHIENASNFDNSIFSKVYDSGIKKVEKIVQDNRNRQSSFETKRYGQGTEISNVISFIGRRGTGKTSAMMSLCEALGNYNGNKRYQDCSNIGFREANMKNVRFFSLDYIDASILEESEDIFILVLGNMLNYLEMENDRGNEEMEDADYDRRFLQQKFEEIYEDFLNIKMSSQYNLNEYSPYEQLKNVASSQRLRVKFQKLVQKSLEYLSGRCGAKNGEVYLVIPIDDLDMAHYNKQNGKRECTNNKSFEIVNSIQKYLSIPGVIVMAAYNHVNLTQQCTNFFINSDSNGYYTDKDRINQRKVSGRLATQFLDKALTPTYRVYLPSWKKDDYAGKRFKIDVKTGLNSDNIFEKYYERGREILSVRDLLLILYAEKLGVYYDFEGKKSHFLEPDSLRGLKDRVSLFDDIDLPIEEGVREEKQQMVFKKLKDDIYFKFIQEKLSLPEERNLFDDWMELRIDRRSEEIVRLFSKNIEPLGKQNKRMIEQARAIQKLRLYDVQETMDDIVQDYKDAKNVIERMKDNSHVKYNFAELVHCIYHMTRENDRKASKEFVACILHSYTIHLSEIYREYRKEKERIGKVNYILKYRYDQKLQECGYTEAFVKLEERYEILKGVIGESVCGRWAEYYFPEVIGGSIISMGKRIPIPPTFIGYVDNMILDYRVEISGESQEIRQGIKELLFISMLHTDVLNWNSIEVHIYQKEHGKYELTFGREHEDSIELTAFLKYTFMYPEYLGKMEKLLVEGVKAASQVNDTIRSRIAKEIVNLFEECGNHIGNGIRSMAV